MLLTLSISSLKKIISLNGRKGAKLGFFDLPDFAINELQLRGLNIPADLLHKRPLTDFDTFRDRADKAGCPCLVLYDSSPQSFGGADSYDAAERVQRLAVAANRLGCNALGIRCGGPDSASTFDGTVRAIKSLMPSIERMELNLLLSPSEGLTSRPERLTDLIKRIGGFRIGALPDFAHAAECGDCVETLRKLAPYAGAIHATIQGFSKNGAHKGYDLAACVAAIRSVGFVNTLAIDYTGAGDPVQEIDKARLILQAAIDTEAS
jgi:hypothetical protein